MLEFTDRDEKIINNTYKIILSNLKNYLKQYNVKNELDYSKIIINMLYNGLFSINGIIKFDNNYNYLELPSTISQGVHVMYGICCCRHATEFLYDLLHVLNFNPSLGYFLIDNDSEIWRRVNPSIEKANHETILLTDNEIEYIIDPVNQFILEIGKDGQLRSLDISIFNKLKFYQESNIGSIVKVLKKYYTYKNLGIKNVY